ncbi:Uncharacterised protein [Streptococcus vestibularis]|uniref:Uncharacterized protein n=1 Tax=Streptococcus vestibularis TaxID=1343 RepID=A0A564TN96_STRVE|nr:Uncharacterised protein [Streptococcus vestibularis]
MESSTKRVNTSRESINILYIISLKLVTHIFKISYSSKGNGHGIYLSTV